MGRGYPPRRDTPAGRSAGCSVTLTGADPGAGEARAVVAERGAGELVLLRGVDQADLHRVEAGWADRFSVGVRAGEGDRVEVGQRQGPAALRAARSLGDDLGRCTGRSGAQARVSGVAPALGTVVDVQAELFAAQPGHRGGEVVAGFHRVGVVLRGARVHLIPGVVLSSLADAVDLGAGLLDG